MIDQILSDKPTSMLIGAALGLLAAGAVAIFGVWACNRWDSRQDRRQLRRVAQMRHRLYEAQSEPRWDR